MPILRNFRRYAAAKTFVHALGLNSSREWKEWCKSGEKPNDIPANPPRSYKQQWESWGDWLGSGRIADQYKVYRIFDDAKNYVHGLKFKNQDQWNEWCKSGQKPNDIPANPSAVYKEQWQGWGDWLGTGYIALNKRHYLPFEDAKKYVHGLKFKNHDQWRDWCKSGEKPSNIPASPAAVYKEQWQGTGDWLGTNTIALQNKVYRSFEEAHKYVMQLGFRTRDEYSKWCKSGQKPNDIPANPSAVYKEQWQGWGDWLGTGYIIPANRTYRSFTKARAHIHALQLDNTDKWFEYCRSGNKPDDIPTYPDAVYEDEWIGWPEWLGYEERKWSLRKVKELLRDLIETRIIYQWDEAVLYSLLLRKGVLDLSENRHTKFFQSLIEASRTEEGRKVIEEYTNSNSEVPPDLSEIIHLSAENKEEIETVTSQELAQIVGNEDPLDYGRIKTAEQILANTDILESINVDEEAIQFYLDYSIDELWKSAFRYGGDKAVSAIKRNGNRFHDTVVDTFLIDYAGTQAIKSKLPDGYSFPHGNPTLMQLYVAHKIRTNSFFGNFSGTGAGKTLSAVLASRVTDSKMTVIVCPNDVVDQWAKHIVEIFSDSKVITGKEAFNAKYDKSRYQYLVLNYDKFSLEDSPNLILNLVKEKVDFIILDEVHFVKKRDEEISKRRRNLGGLVTAVRRKNNQAKVLGLSATPVVNNLMEGRSLLELITGKIYDDVSTRPTIPNAVTLYEKLSTISIRELPQYNIDIHTENVEVNAERPPNLTVKYLKSNPLAIEQFLTDARIPEIVKRIEGQTIIYTEYVTDVIKKLSKALENEGYSYAEYTGSDHSGKERFLNKKVQVIIASRPISVGVDGLQHICNRLIINTLPWTNAQYQQLLGRLVRKGQIRDVVNVHIVKASISGYPYDQLKWNRIEFKRTLADCAVDGRLPEKNLITPQQAAMEAVKWLERLEEGKISGVVRRDLNVELTPVEIEQRVRKYGDFTRLNNQLNNENSATTHERMLKDLTEWEEYHRQYRRARKDWSIIPYEEIINRIKQLFTNRMLAAVQIADLGCGEAKIMEAFGPDRVYSFDHVAVNDKVIACDMKKVELADDVLDVAVFSLSLMGRNWIDYIIEAKRCLATNGYMLIAETTKSMKGRLSNLRDVITVQGFEIYTDEERGDFTFIEARLL